VATVLRRERPHAGAGHAADTQQLLDMLLESAGQSLPQDPRMGATLIRQWIATATASMESVQKAAMQLAEVADANWKTVSSPAGRPE
jgi:hypothetical protein